MKGLNLPVREFTTPDPITASKKSSVEELENIMGQNGIRHILILDGCDVVGIISERDLKLVRSLRGQYKDQISAEDIMTREPVVVDAETPLDQVAFKMSSRKIGSVIVNEDDELLGIFTSTDALNALIEITRSSTLS